MQVTKIIEGGIDLTTGEKLDVGIVVSNGARELMIPISEATLQILSVMIAEAGLLNNPTPKKGIGEVPFEDRPLQPEEIFKEELSPDPASKPRLVEETSPAPAPAFPADEDEGFEPGEEYDDIGTGASSL